MKRRPKPTRAADGSREPTAVEAFRAYAAGPALEIERDVNRLDPLAAAIIRRCWRHDVESLEAVADSFGMPAQEMAELEEQAFEELGVWAARARSRQRRSSHHPPRAEKKRPRPPKPQPPRGARALLVRAPPRGPATLVELPAGQEIVLGSGRRAHGRVVQPGVRSRHATVCWPGGATVTVRELGRSRATPTRVDGYPVEDEAAVISGSEIRIRSARWVVVLAGMGQASAAANPANGSLDVALRHVELAMLLDALQACGGNRSRAAERLGISRRALIYKMHKNGLMNQSGGTRGSAGK